MKKKKQETNVDEIMEKHGFGVGSSGGGCEWYTKPITYKGTEAFIAITDDGGLSLPESLSDPIYVGIYDVESGDEIKKAKKFPSLKSYLDTLKD